MNNLRERSVMNRFQKFLNSVQNRNVYIRGTKDRGIRIGAYFDTIQFIFKGYTDIDSSKWDKEIWGNHLCYSPNTIVKGDIVLIAVGNKQICNDIKDELDAQGIENYMITEDIVEMCNYRTDKKIFLKAFFQMFMGYPLNLDNPKTFNEKIQWLKVYDSTPLKGKLADKYLVRNYVNDVIGGQYLVPMLGIWEKFNEIDFEKLPERFVLKCTHGSGMNKIIQSKRNINYTETKMQFEQWLAINYAYQSGMEMHYQYISPRIIAEEYLQTEDGSDLRDYKVHVFNGKAKLVQVDIDREHIHRRNLYTTEWEYLPYSLLYPTASDVVIHKPECLEELIRLSEMLAKGFIYVRVDFYIVKKHIYFGEMTFTHGSGVEKFTPDLLDSEMGEWMQLPDERMICN